MIYLYFGEQILIKVMIMRMGRAMIMTIKESVVVVAVVVAEKIQVKVAAVKAEVERAVVVKILLAEVAEIIAIVVVEYIVEVLVTIISISSTSSKRERGCGDTDRQTTQYLPKYESKKYINTSHINIKIGFLYLHIHHLQKKAGIPRGKFLQKKILI